MRQYFRLLGLCWAFFGSTNAFLQPFTIKSFKYDGSHRTLGADSASNSLTRRLDSPTTAPVPTCGISPRISPQRNPPPLYRRPRAILHMSALGPIGPFSPFKSNYCSSGVVEKEMASLTNLAQALSTKFSRMMLGFQVISILPLRFDRLDLTFAFSVRAGNHLLQVKFLHSQRRCGEPETYMHIRCGPLPAKPSLRSFYDIVIDGRHRDAQEHQRAVEGHVDTVSG
jgi:hypothetical protein